MLYQRRMRLPHVEDPTLNGTPLERMMLSLTSDGVTIGNAEPTVSVQDMPGRDGRLDLTLTDPSGAAYMGDRAITLSLYAIGGGYSVLAFTFSGLTFPIMAMSKPMQWFCCIFPFTFYTDIMVDQALRGAPAIYSLPDMGIIALFIILPLLCLPRLRTICTNKKYWGRL